MSKQITIISLIIASIFLLSLGSIIGVKFSQGLFEEPVLLTESDFASEEFFFGFNTYGENYVYNEFTLGQFARYVNANINNRDELVRFLKFNKFEVFFEEEDIIVANRDLGCVEDRVFREEVCSYEELTYIPEDDLVEHVVIFEKDSSEEEFEILEGGEIDEEE